MNEYAVIEASLNDTSTAFNMLPIEERKKINLQSIKAYNNEKDKDIKKEYAGILIENNAALLGKAMNRFFAQDKQFLQANKSEFFDVAVSGFLDGVSHFKGEDFDNLNYTLPYINHALMDHANFLKNKNKYEAGIERQIKQARNILNKKGVEENIQNLAQYTKVSAGVLKKNYNGDEFVLTKLVSIDEDDDDENGTSITIPDETTPEDLYIQDEGMKIIKKALNIELDENEIKILVYTYGIFGVKEKSDLQISKMLKITATAVKQMRNKALVKLSYNQELREYFEFTKKDLGYEPFTLDFVLPQDGEDLFDYFETPEGQEYLKNEEKELIKTYGEDCE